MHTEPMTNHAPALHSLKRLDELTGKNRKWAERWLTEAEPHDLPDGFSVGDRVRVGDHDEAEVLGAHTAADGTRWLALWGLKSVVAQFPCWEAPASEVSPL